MPDEQTIVDPRAALIARGVPAEEVAELEAVLREHAAAKETVSDIIRRRDLLWVRWLDELGIPRRVIALMGQLVTGEIVKVEDRTISMAKERLADAAEVGAR